jgi:hypothetical protein
VLYLGPFRLWTAQRVDAARIRRDPAYLEELHRRGCLMVGRGVDTTAMFQAPASPLMFPDGVRPSLVQYDPVTPLPATLPPLPADLPSPCDRLLLSPRR